MLQRDLQPQVQREVQHILAYHVAFRMPTDAPDRMQLAGQCRDAAVRDATAIAVAANLRRNNRGMSRLERQRYDARMGVAVYWQARQDEIQQTALEQAAAAYGRGARAISQHRYAGHPIMQQALQALQDQEAQAIQQGE
jgi:hypothetical protein